MPDALSNTAYQKIFLANRVKESYAGLHGDNIWNKIADYFCLGSVRKAAREIFYKLQDACKNKENMSALVRFSELQKLAGKSGEYFSVNTKNKDMMLFIGNENIAKIKNISENDADLYLQASVIKINAAVVMLSPPDTSKLDDPYEDHKNFTKKIALETMTDNQDNSNCTNSQISITDLQGIFQDKRLNSNNYKGYYISGKYNEVLNTIWRIGTNDYMIPFCNREPSNHEFRGPILERMLRTYKYSSLEEMIEQSLHTMDNVYINVLRSVAQEAIIDCPRVVSESDDFLKRASKYELNGIGQNITLETLLEKPLPEKALTEKALPGTYLTVADLLPATDPNKLQSL
ncbi:hypothetical protein HVW15_10385 [Escherichia fergusonii]|uniref:hypothetical protein n=1 Tax=Escherichia fergusonii TaxID=564 RepID=UPI0015F5B0F3|nr:hypothetical protein [Escherichia fergusonii]MBA8501402.1 hypothetical protein [Escherichia fergusonii]